MRQKSKVIPGPPKGRSLEPMNTGLWNMGPGLAVSRRPGMTRLGARLGKPSEDDLRAVLDRVPENPPTPGDELPPGLAAELRRA